MWNVKDFGACGNGTNDDTSSINAAIATAFSNGGGEVFFPAGNYKISSAIAVTNKVFLVGSGYQATQITNSTSTAATFTFDSLVVDGGGISNMGIQYSPTKAAAGGVAILIGPSAYIKVSDSSGAGFLNAESALGM